MTRINREMVQIFFANISPIYSCMYEMKPSSILGLSILITHD
ncbi:hypothetical protein LINPERHAP2_LOCUS32533 [Linum perenne]